MDFLVSKGSCQETLLNIKVNKRLLCNKVTLAVSSFKDLTSRLKVSSTERNYFKMRLEMREFLFKRRFRFMPWPPQVEFIFIIILIDEHPTIKREEEAIVQLEIPVSLLSISLPLPNNNFFLVSGEAASSCYAKRASTTGRWFVGLPTGAFLIRTSRAN